MREPGHVRILRGQDFAQRIERAKGAGDTDLATRLPLILIPGKWEDSYRLPFPDLVLDRLFGVGQHESSVVIWGRGDVIELWSTQRWIEAVERTLADGDAYLSEG